jgi:hypothetical protein
LNELIANTLWVLTRNIGRTGNRSTLAVGLGGALLARIDFQTDVTAALLAAFPQASVNAAYAAAAQGPTGVVAGTGLDPLSAGIGAAASLAHDE